MTFFVFWRCMGRPTSGDLRWMMPEGDLRTTEHTIIIGLSKPSDDDNLRCSFTSQHLFSYAAHRQESHKICNNISRQLSKSNRHPILLQTDFSKIDPSRKVRQKQEKCLHSLSYTQINYFILWLQPYSCYIAPSPGR